MKKILVSIVGLEPGTSGSVVQRFNHLATKQPLYSPDPPSAYTEGLGTLTRLTYTLRPLKVFAWIVCKFNPEYHCAAVLVYHPLRFPIAADLDIEYFVFIAN